MTDITNFNRNQDRNFTSYPLEVHLYPEPNNTVSVILKGVDVTYIAISDFLWTRNLNKCTISKDIRLKQQLWPSTWLTESDFGEYLLASQCNPDNKTMPLRIYGYLLEYMLNLKRNLINGTLHFKSITADRYTVIDHFSYKVLLNITGIWDNQDNIYGPVRVEDLKKTIDQKGFRFVKQLDNFTVLVEATAKLEARFPVSTLYNWVSKPQTNEIF